MDNSEQMPKWVKKLIVWGLVGFIAIFITCALVANIVPRVLLPNAMATANALPRVPDNRLPSPVP